jgi:hypothetical protein
VADVCISANLLATILDVALRSTHSFEAFVAPLIGAKVRAHTPGAQSRKHRFLLQLFRGLLHAALLVLLLFVLHLHVFAAWTWG